MSFHNNVLELIGNTPIVRVNHLDTGPCELYLKLENHNPGGSIKDRIALKMIEQAERRGDLRPGATIVEGTAGNTGLGLALVAAQKGYRLVLVIPDKMSQEKISNLKAMGAEVIITRSDVGKGHPEYYQDLAQSIAEQTDNAYFINQFGNPDNPLAHETMTGPEILGQMGDQLDAVVVGVGSSGTVTGLSRCFAREAPEIELVLADPEGSILADYIATGKVRDDAGGWLVEGIGEDFLPSISDFSRVRKAYSIPDRESFLTARELLQHEGLLGGSSTGTLVAAALRYCREQTEPRKVLSLVCDTGNKYLSKVYNDYWMREQGFSDTEKHGDLRDLIARSVDTHDAVTVGRDEPLSNAYKRMKLYDVSQLPVLDGDCIVGIIDESDILLAVYDHEERFSEPVSSAMVTELESVQVDAAIDDLLPIFNRDHVAIVMEGERFLGLITRVDLLNYLRRRADR
ncbi:pyridoxal-phosphate dependent enzyme [Wenzhouxiangella sp. AB-CW3]|uniref:pyridoxal-phosphate dependent enzyme n=1 Tax=Wenzhouxiangella sp. AB-CW3 TaxID=2771012 RepID=UPI00168B04E7|nr:pyridoxal-phosphate dependent enzyme [Wenzhouxiangella sp. AB-CW3]QOC21670.1 pyridoxal-phosphate dependent enzyme [Wenzhouxiangella sp. AB-CW3]